jgi:hypothetical protein
MNQHHSSSVALGESSGGMLIASDMEHDLGAGYGAAGVIVHLLTTIEWKVVFHVAAGTTVGIASLGLARRIKHFFPWFRAWPGRAHDNSPPHGAVA